MEWSADISSLGKTWMTFLGEFSPTVSARERQVKGYMWSDGGCGKVYLDAGELRELASACLEAADWLDNRAAMGGG